MSNRKNIVAGNWKMNTNLAEGHALATALATGMELGNTTVILGTPYISLHAVNSIISNTANLHLAGQNCHQETSGAYTGEISAAMLKSVGCGYVILGHSERREYFQENDQLIHQKIKIALDNDLLPIFCCGEKLPVREAGEQEQVVGEQVKNALFSLDADQMSKIVIAYEPVWAIGTGVTASDQQAQDMHAYIRSLIKEQFGKEIADNTSILYGGSVKPSNAVALFSKPDVDGGLVGGASLKADMFLEIIKSI